MAVGCSSASTPPTIVPQMRGRNRFMVRISMPNSVVTIQRREKLSSMA